MDFLKKVSEKMKSDRKFALGVYAVLVISCILIYMSVTSGKGEENINMSAGRNTEISVSDTEVRLKEILSALEGAGTVDVMVKSSSEGGTEKIWGVIVASSGAKDIAVRLMLHDAVCTVLGIEDDKVQIFEMKEVENDEEKR